MASDRTPASAEWKLHWPMVLACSFGFSMSTVMSHSLGLFMQPLQTDLGWTRSQIAVGFTISSISSIFLSPVAGAMIDRWGSRWLAIVGVTLTSLGLASFGLVDSFGMWIAIWFYYALVSMGVKLTVWTTAPSKAFTTSRGLAVACVIAGTAFTGVFAPPITYWLIEHFGWREAFFLLGLGWGLPALLLAVFFLFETDRSGARQTVAERAVTTASLTGLSMHAALRDWALWRIALSTLIFLIFAGTMVIHQIPILIEAGVDKREAALLASLAAIAGFFGKLVTGALMDRVHAAKLSGVTLALCSIAFALLIEPFRSPVTIVVAMVLVGYTGGAKLQVTTYLTGRYGGLRNFGKIFGLMGSVIAIGAAIGPLTASAVYDLTGGYSWFLITGVPGCLISGLLIFSLGAYPRWDEAMPEPARA